MATEVTSELPNASGEYTNAQANHVSSGAGRSVVWPRVAARPTTVHAVRDISSSKKHRRSSLGPQASRLHRCYQRRPVDCNQTSTEPLAGETPAVPVKSVRVLITGLKKTHLQISQDEIRHHLPHVFHLHRIRHAMS